jgi:YHS domain-containing protein
MRFLLGLFAILAAFLLLRSLLEPVVKAVVALLAPPASTSMHASAGPKAETRSGELKRDPVCGVFVAPEVAVTQSFGGQIVHFCSQKCCDQYASARKT